METAKWMLIFFLMTSCQSIAWSQKLSANLTMSELSRGIVKFNSTVNGKCEVTGGMDSFFNISLICITSNNGTPLPLGHTWISSDNTIQFVIPNIQKNQFGIYKCLYNDSGRIRFLAKKFIHVLAEPLEVKSLHIVVNNWENYTITMVPSLQEQDNHTHDQKDRYTKLRTKAKYDYLNKCPHSGGNVVVPKNCTPDKICRTSDQCCNYSCDCDNGNCYCNDRPVMTDATTCFGVRIWTDELGEPETYNKVFQVILGHHVKPSSVDSRTTKLDIINSSSLNISWLEDGMWSIRGQRRVQYDVSFEATNFKHVVKLSNLRQPFLTQTDLTPHGRYKVCITVKPLKLGIPSDASVTNIAMPESVPSRNPSFIGYSEANHDEIKTVTLYWEPLSEIDKNGQNVRTEVELGGQPFCNPTNEESSCSGNIRVGGGQMDQVVRIYSRSMSLGRNTSAPISAMKIAGTVGDSPQLNLEVSRLPDGLYNMTSRAPVGPNLQAMVVMCEKDAKDNKCTAKAPLYRFGQVDDSAGVFRLDERKGFNPYKIGAILPGKPDLIEWSPCIYEQGRVPLRPAVSLDKLLPGELMVHVGKYSCSKNTGTGVKVPKITGNYCRTSQDKSEECIGRATEIEIKNLDEWTTYDVDGGLYRVSLQAVADDGMKSEEWTGSLEVPSKGINPEYIAVIIIAIIIPVIVIMIGVGICWKKELICQQERLPIALPSKPLTRIDFVETPERMSAPPSPTNRCHLPPKPVQHLRVVGPSRAGISYKLSKMRKACHNDCDDYARGVMRNNHHDLSEADDSCSHDSEEKSCSSGTFTPDTSSTSDFGSGRSDRQYETSTNYTDPCHPRNNLSFDGDVDNRTPAHEDDSGESPERDAPEILEDRLESADTMLQLPLKKWSDEFPVQCFQAPLISNPKEDSNPVCDDVLIPMPHSKQNDSSYSGANRIPYKRSASGTSGDSISGASGEPTTGNSGASNELSYVKMTVKNPIFENTAPAQDAFTFLPALIDDMPGLGEIGFRESCKDYSQQNNSEEGQKTEL